VGVLLGRIVDDEKPDLQRGGFLDFTAWTAGLLDNWGTLVAGDSKCGRVQMGRPTASLWGPTISVNHRNTGAYGRLGGRGQAVSSRQWARNQDTENPSEAYVGRGLPDVDRGVACSIGHIGERNVDDAERIGRTRSQM